MVMCGTEPCARVAGNRTTSRAIPDSGPGMECQVPGRKEAMTFNRAIIGFFALALASSAARAQTRTPLYTPPPTPAPAHPQPGAATPVLCVYWLQNNRSALNEPAGPGGRDPVVRVTGPSATTGSFGADNTTCRLTLIHASGMRETGWLTLRPSLRWAPEN